MSSVTELADTRAASVGVPEAVQAGEGGPPERRRRRRLGPGKRLPAGIFWGPALLIVLWSVTSATGWLDEEALPGPWVVVEKGWAMILDGQLATNLASSLARAATGLVIGVVFGVLFALISGLSRLGEALVDGPLQIKRAIPILAIIPLAIVWWGIGEEMKIILISLATLMPVYINTTAALTGVDLRYVELAETLGLSRGEFIRKVALPGALPGFFTGLRLSATVALLVLVVVEQTNAVSGIGYLMNQARVYGQTDVIAVGLVVYAVLGLALDLLIRFIERKALRWRVAIN